MTENVWYKNKKLVNEYYKEEQICQICNKKLKRSTMGRHKNSYEHKYKLLRKEHSELIGEYNELLIHYRKLVKSDD